MARVGLPFLLFVLLIAGWHFLVVINEIPAYILPGPGTVLTTLIKDWPILSQSMINTLAITGLALVVATLGGVGLAILFSQSRLVEYSLFPYAVVLQVTPVVAVFPLINIYVENTVAKLLICAWIIAFFPILSNTTLGLNSADRNLHNLFALYGASRWQTLRHLQLPAAMPYFLGGLRIAGGLSLVGAVVAEFVAGTAGFGSGLAFRIIEAGYRLNIPRMFAAIILISVAGIMIYLVLSLVSHLILRKWHESALDREK
nr:ABC transporter permease [Amorphus orientalis]